MKPLSDFLTSTTIKPLLDNSNRMVSLNATLRRLNKDEWTKFCTIANFEQGVLTLVTANSSWATKIRFLIPEITKTLAIHPEFNALEQVKCKIIHSHIVQPVVKQERKLSIFVYELLTETAENIKHTDLKKSLLKLAGKIRTL